MTSWRRLRWTLFALAIGPTCGCSQGGSASEFDGERARQTLITALDAWKEGEHRQLAQLDPPIRFADEDANDGARLVHYELTQPDAALGPFVDIPVEIQIRETRGKSVTRSVSYQVTLEPSLAVLRSDP